MDHVDHNTPDLKVHGRRDFHGREGVVLRDQIQFVIFLLDPLDGKLAVEDGHDNSFVPGFQGTVHDEDVPGLNPGINH